MSKLHPHKFFTNEEKQRLVHAIQEAEKLTSGEIRLHLAHQCKKDPLDEAKRTFEKLGMTRTAERNGMLFFLSLLDHQFVILGDQGIHEKVGQEFWHSIRDVVLEHFKKEQFVEGLVAGIKKCGEKLAEHFPHKEGDLDEFSDEVSEGRPNK
jgi:uncharacterized membrane protein